MSATGLAESVCLYLDDTGFAYDRAAGCELLPASRNIVGCVRAPDGAHRYVVKLGHGRDLAGDGVLLSEGLFYLLAGDAGGDVCRALPRCVRHDRQADVLIFVESIGRSADAPGRRAWRRCTRSARRFAACTRRSPT